MKLKNLRLKYTYILCVLVTPFIVYRITLIETLAEAMRPDDYSMGRFYYVLLISIGVMSNTLIVLLTQFAAPFEKKFKLIIKATALTIGAILLGVLLFFLVYAISMSTSHWSFG